MLKQLITSTIISGIVLTSSVIGLAAAAPVRRIPTPANPLGAASAPKEINHKNSPYFTQPDFFNMKSNKHLTILTHYPTYQQTTEETCASAAGLTILYYFGDTRWTEAALTKEMHTQPYPIGTSTKNIVGFFTKAGYRVDSSLTNKKTFPDYVTFQNFVLKNLQANTAILVENIEWGGHWRVIIGYDTMGTKSTLDDVLIMQDAYDTSDHYQDGYAINNGERFYAMWFDEPSGRNEPSLKNIWVTVKK